MKRAEFMFGYGTLLVIIINIEAEKGKPYKHYLTLENEKGKEIACGRKENYSSIATLEYNKVIIGHCTHTYTDCFPTFIPFEIKPLIKKGN